MFKVHVSKIWNEQRLIQIRQNVAEKMSTDYRQLMRRADDSRRTVCVQKGSLDLLAQVYLKQKDIISRNLIHVQKYTELVIQLACIKLFFNNHGVLFALQKCVWRVADWVSRLPERLCAFIGSFANLIIGWFSPSSKNLKKNNLCCLEFSPIS